MVSHVDGGCLSNWSILCCFFQAFSSKLRQEPVQIMRCQHCGRQNLPTTLQCWPEETASIQITPYSSIATECSHVEEEENIA